MCIKVLKILNFDFLTGIQSQNTKIQLSYTMYLDKNLNSVTNSNMRICLYRKHKRYCLDIT